MSNVYWIKGRCESVRKNIISKIDALMNLDEMAKLVVPDESLAIKINLSEIGYSHYLPPIIIATVFSRPGRENTGHGRVQPVQRIPL